MFSKKMMSLALAVGLGGAGLLGSLLHAPTAEAHGGYHGGYHQNYHAPRVRRVRSRGLYRSNNRAPRYRSYGRNGYRPRAAARRGGCAPSQLRRARAVYY